MDYIFSGVTHIGCVRTINQDNYYFNGSIRALDQDEAVFDEVINGSGRLLLAVFDGMGGESCGEIASLIAAERMKDLSADDGVDPAELITQINTELCSEMDRRNIRMGSTCVILEFDEGRCRSLNLGDSRAYHFHGGSLELLSEDHTESASYSSLFRSAGTASHINDNTLTQHLGIPEDDFIIEPYISPWHRVMVHDIYMICSDGLTHMVDDDTICEVLSSDNPLSVKRDHLLGLSLENGGFDNITIILAENMAAN